jgi:hypothetical protein
MLVAKLHFRMLLFENCNVLLCQIATEPTKFGCMPNKLDQRLLWKHRPIAITIFISGMLQGDVLQIGILLKEHPVCSTIMARGIFEPCHLYKLDVLLAVRSDWGRSVCKRHSKGINMNLAEVGHAVVDREWIWLPQREHASAIGYLSAVQRKTLPRKLRRA